MIDITSTAIQIKGLRVFAHHGVLPQERAVGNEYLVDATLVYDAAQAMNSDVIDHALNYASAVEVIRTEMKIDSDLLESVALRVANALTDTFDALDSGSVTITKVKPPFAGQLDGVSFTLEWTRRLKTPSRQHCAISPRSEQNPQ